MLSRHRRPSRLARLGRAGGSLHLTVSAGVAGSVAVTGTVVAVAADGTTAEQPGRKADDRRSPVADVVRAAINTADLGNPDAALQLRQAVTAEQREQAERLAEARARAIAKRKAERLEAQRRATEKRARQARQLQAASRSVERMSASAANVLRIAAQVASGAQYSYGGDGPTAFDCSGFTSYVFDKVGISLPRSSSAQRSVALPVSNPQPGDLVFVYNGGGGSIGHVGIYAGNGYWWEAANPSMGVGKHRAWSSDVSYGRVL